MDDDDYADTESLSSVYATSPRLSQYTLHHQPSYQPAPSSQRTQLPPYSSIPPSYATLAAPPALPPRSRSAVSSSVPLAQRDEQDTSQNGRRRLLLLFIHGFMGNETSFQSFPRHVHDLVSILLSNSHVVQTKIYPRYRSKDTITVARDQFSAWLTQNESPNTDIVLCGHSMGGILASEVALLRSPGISPKHHILGTINFDTPFLGMHPGIIAAGISSLFSTNHTPAKSPLSSSDGTPLPFSSPQSQAYFNTAFSNDVRLPTRSGWANALNFITGNAKNLKSATVQLVSSYADFGSCLADYDGLRERYKRIRILEEEEEDVRRSVMKTRQVPRIRFVNYYTVSTGRSKIKPSSAGGIGAAQPESSLPTANTSTTSLANTVTEAEVETPSIGLDSPFSNDRPLISCSASSSISSASSYASAMDFDVTEQGTTTAIAAIAPPTISHTLPIPPQPPVPPPLQSQKDVRTYNTALKAYEQEIKLYRKQTKLFGKDLPAGETNAKELDRTAKDAQKAAKKTEKLVARKVTSQSKSRRAAEAQSLTKPTPLIAGTSSSRNTFSTTKNEIENENDSAVPFHHKQKAKKQRTFCVLPPADKHNVRDPCWAKVHMVGVDEVGAHCGLFFPQDIAQTDAIATDPTTVPSNAETLVVDAVVAAAAEDAPRDMRSVSNDNAASPPNDAAHAIPNSISNIALNTHLASTTHLATPQEDNAQAQGEEEQWSARYANLIQDVSTRIESWVLEAMSERLVRSFD